MNRDDPEIAAYFERSQAWGLGGRMALLVEGPEPQLDHAVAAVRERLAGEPTVARTTGLGPLGVAGDGAARRPGGRDPLAPAAGPVPREPRLRGPRDRAGSSRVPQ
jgi:hypothetical protein